MSNDIRRKGRTFQSAAIAAASILELQFFTRSAQAQEATGDVSAFQDIASVDGVASVETLDDGSVEITMEDGSVLTVPAGEVQILNGTVFVSDSFLIAQGLTASSNNTVLLLALGAAGVAVAANALESSSDSDDDVVPPVATPPPPPMPPVFTSSATADVAENQIDAYRAVATDADSDTLSYSLSGTDASRFMIDSATGEVRFIEAPDFEAPGDADADNVYDIVVTASDGANTAERTVAIMVTDENEAPVFTSDAAVSVAENQTVAYTALATDADGDDLSYNLSGTDAALFMIDATTGEVRFIEAPDFENPGDADGDNVYDIVVTASDGTNSTDQTVAITVTNENDNAPSFTSDAAVSVAENQTVAYTALAMDADGDDLSYNLSGTDAALFMIDATTGEVRFIEAPDFEAPGNADGDNVYDIVVTASDGTNSTDQAVAITVTDENEAPIFTSDAAVSVAENQTAAYAAVATDVDGDDLSYNLSGTDAARFMIDGATGEVRFIEAPDFENPGDADGDNVYDIVVTASDGTNSTDQAVAITVTDETDITAFQRLLDNPEEASVADFEAAGIERVNVLTLDATRELLQAVGENDPETLASLTPQQVQAITDIARDHIVSISGPEDAGIYDSGEFTLGSNPAIVSVEAGSFIAALDYDGDGETDHIVTIEFDADYRVQRVERDFGANNEADDPPDAVEVVERPDDRTVQITYDIQGDGDTDRIETYTLDESGDRIQIDVDTDADGSTDRVESYEVDAGGNRIQTDFDDDADGATDRIEISTYDESGNRVQTDFDDDADGTIDRTEDIADAAPVFTSPATANVAENRTEAYTAIATDADSDALTYSLSGTDAALFTIDPDTGVVSFITPPDFETPGDDGRNNVYDITVTATDGSNEVDRDVTITVTDVDDGTNVAPVFTSPTSADVAETQTLAYMSVATDADGDTLMYSLSGTDAARFMIDPTTGAVRFIASPDFENPGDAGGNNVYDITVTASDGDNSTNHDVAITVTNVNDNTPSFSSPDSASVAENETLAYMAVATDADGDDLSYSLSGTDAALFTIDGTTGAVRFTASPDFENPGDAGGDNVYDITVTATDGSNEVDRDVAITVTDVDDGTNVAPVFTSPTSADVAETQTLAYMSVATDADGDTLMYSLSGTDAALFTIDPDTGVVSFITPPDFERPGDDGRNNVYDITVTASDGDNSTDQNVAITVTDEDEVGNAPSFTSPDSASVEENQTMAYTAMATDADGDDLSYSLFGTDATLFTIDPATGVVRFRAAPDFENPGDIGGDNVYDIIVTASDNTGGTTDTDQAVAITVTDANDAPVFSSPATASAAENQSAATVVYRAVATDADGDALSYSLSGTDAALFTIDANTGDVRFREAPDAENPGDDDNDNIYDIIVTASDNIGGTADTDQAVAITVTNVNDNAPVFSSPATANVEENQTAAYTAVATDADGDPLTYSLSGTDAALFTIAANTGEVRFNEAPDFEAPGSADGDNVYDIIVTASDNTSGTTDTDQAVAITVTNANDNAPVFSSPATATVAENQRSAYRAVATDMDGDPLSYSLSGADAALFTIDANTGDVSFREAPDFENPGSADGDNVYDIIVTASDGAAANDIDQAVAITVTDENEVGNAPVFNSPATASVAENQSAATVVYTAVATDADGDALSYSLSGTDAALFTIDANTGEVRFNEAPDFENPGSADGDNVYDIIVTASDNTGGTADTDQAVAITVTNANDNAPVFNSPATATVAENQRSAYRAVATDGDGDPLGYSLSGGADAALFTINETTGEVSFATPPDFENPADAGGDNVYDIIITATDGVNETEQAVAITVTDENDPPVFTSPATAAVAENQTDAYTAQATDADSDSLSYRLSGTDAALFTLDATTGVVSFATPPDFENPADAGGDNVYDIIITASDGTTANDTDQAVAITVTNENDNTPVFNSPASAEVAENQSAATVVYTAAATDADGDTLSYGLSGTDAGLFTINPTTGAVSFVAPPDFEMPGDDDGDNVYDIIVTASDNTGGTTDTDQAVAITVTDVNDNAPVFSSPATASVAENQSAATVVYRAVATNADGDALSYSLSGTDAALFTIDANTGEVRFNEAPDFEAPGSADGDNVYDIIVTASDNTASTLGTDQAVAITVTNVNDNAPVFNSPATASVAENQSAATVVYRAVATDADGDALGYSLSGTDAAQFTIDANTGDVRFREAPDAENPGDDDDDNVYDIIVTASDNTGGTTDTDQAVAITVTGVNDSAPVFSSPATASVAENQSAATVVYRAVATDADGDALSYSLSGTDAARFTIDANTGDVRFREAPDAENPGDDDDDNVYDIIVTASDNTAGTTDTDQAVAITVTDANDNAPVFSSPATASVAENQTAAYTTQATDADGDALSYSLSGTDAALFTIDANTGEVRFREAPDAENPGDDDNDNVYDIIVTVTASDNTGGTTDTDQVVAITVTNVNDNAPVFSSLATASVAENQSAATVVYRAVATDADGDVLSYSLSGTDAARFTIDANTGDVRFREAPDAENPGDDDNDNVYDIIVTASDNTGGTTDTNQAVTITVTNANDNTPSFTSGAIASVAENQTIAYTAMAADADAGDTVSYSLSGGADAALFTIDATMGVISFITAPDFENPGDAGGDNVYDITVTASDGSNSVDQTVAITVTDEYDLVPLFSLSALDGTNGFILNGIDGGDYSGASVSSAGDVNGDGYDDLIIGAFRAAPNRNSDAGETYIVYGGANAPGTEGVLDLSDLDGTNGFILNGIDRDDFSGLSVSSAGDVNGDGYYDLIIGAKYADPNRNSAAGETYIVYGGASAPGTNGVLDLSDLDGTNGFIFNGIDAGDWSGQPVSSAGDVNGDGYDDLIIGAHRADPNGDRSGETYIVYGGASAPGTGGRFNLSTLNGTNGFTLNGIDADDRSGLSVSSAGDVNGDGYDDLIIGAFRAAPNRNSDAGETYIVYGGASAPGTNGVLDLSDLDGSNGFILNGIDANDRSGSSVSSAGDVNGDGYDDLIIGARRADPNGDSSAGETYVVYGGASAPGTDGVLDLSDLDGTNGIIINGIDASDYSGRSVSSAGDVNGDGYDDLIIGASSTDPNGDSSAGETYVIYGGATGTESLTPVTAQGTAAADNFTGNAGADSFTAIATNDVVRGGAGDDRISVTALDFAAIDGGTGQDTLVLDGAGLSLDLTGAGHAGVDSVEVFDLSGTGANTLVLDAQAVFDLTEERDGGIASLDVLGDADDRVEFRNSFTASGTVTEGDTTYTVYRAGNAEVRVQTGVQVQIPAATAPVFSSDATAGVAENQSLAYTAVATDADGDALSYSLSGTDAALFRIGPNTGVVSFRQAPDFEMPGDDGGNNVYDITVTASDGSNAVDQAVAITVTDVYEPVPLSTLDGTNGFILNGIDRLDYSGRSVSSAGDVNGDGYDDLIIGAWQADPNGNGEAGETYIVYGGASAPGTGGRLNLSTLDGTDGFILNGIDADDRSGRFVSSAGDVNGDGYDDLIIGAIFADPNGNSSGETYVVYGGASAPQGGALDLSMLDGTNGFILNGIDGGDRSGNSVSSAGDVNGDGYDDLIIGAHEADPNGNFLAGETYVIYGGASAPGTEGVLDLSDLDGINGFILNGIDRLDYSGSSVSSAGDVNGDGYDDLIIGAYDAEQPDGASDEGETYVVYGGERTAGVLALSDLDGSNGFVLAGIDDSDLSGTSVSSAGDVNGDGYDDLIIGARLADPNGDVGAGETYVVYGGASAPGTDGVLDLSDLDGTNGFILNGIDRFDNSGRSVSSAGDVNGDGYDDLIIGARYADPNGDSSAGETYVVYGGASAPGTGGVLDLSDLDGTNGIILNGIDTNDLSGSSVSSAGDVNGDGYDDLIIGAHEADPNGGSSGETYVIYGGATGTESLVPVMASGTAAADNFTGNAGDDSFTAIATNDVVRGGAGDDNISVTALDFADIDGGTGRDSLVLAGANLSLDLTGAGNGGVDSVEVVDLSGTGANTLVLDALAVFDLTEERNGGIASLDVLGDADDRLELRNSFTASGTATEGDTTYTIYRAGNAEVRVQTGVQVQIPAATAPVFSSDATAVVAENQGLTYTAVATDADGDALTYSLSGTDAALFRIGPNTGVVNFRQTPDFENPGDDDDNNVYDITITASDGSNAVDQAVAITVTDVYEPVPLSTLDGTNGFILNGIDTLDDSGWSVSSAGDVNGDGYDDLIIGARYADPNGNRAAGESYVVYGGATGTESLTPVTAQGTAAADNFTGNAGADSFTAIATNDVVRAAAGDDRISVTALDFAAIDGGTGQDTLVLDGAGLSLDLTGAGNGGVDSVEVVDLSGTGANTLVLDALAMFDLTEERDGGIAGLDVLGDADDRVDLSGGNFTLSGTATEDGTTYNVFSDGNAELRVQNGVPVSLGTMSSGLLSEEPDSVAMPAPDRHRLNEEPMFEDLSVRDSIPDMQDTGEDAVVLMPLPVPALAPMAAPVFAGDKPLQNDLAMILRDMEVFADPANNGDTDMDGF